MEGEVVLLAVHVAVVLVVVPGKQVLLDGIAATAVAVAAGVVAEEEAVAEEELVLAEQTPSLAS